MYPIHEEPDVKNCFSNLSFVPVALYEEVDRSPSRTWNRTGTRSQTEPDEASHPLNHCLLFFSPTLNQSLNLSSMTPSASEQMKGVLEKILENPGDVLSQS